MSEIPTGKELHKTTVKTKLKCLCSRNCDSEEVGCAECAEGPIVAWDKQGQRTCLGYCKDCWTICIKCGEGTASDDIVFNYQGDAYCDNCCEMCNRCKLKYPTDEIRKLNNKKICLECIQEMKF